MILVDTSVWVGHLQAADQALVRLLEAGEVLTHPFVNGELALGSLRQRELITNTLRELPHGPVASDEEVLHFIDRHRLFSSGIGYVDVHLLAAAQLAAGTTLWTRDKRLRESAQRLGLAASEQ
jgi:predicted nucleic acid-binding protein